MLWPTIGLVVLITAIGLFPQPLLGYADRAASQLLAPEEYVEAVGLQRGAGQIRIALAEEETP
jgi:hypothetical protein